MKFSILRPVIALALLVTPGLEAFAQSNNPSGLPLPRFVTTRSAPINVRVGPGTKYDIGWIYRVPGVPVEILQEFEVWRKIRDVDGSEGWVQQSMLSGNRAAYVRPSGEAERTALRRTASHDAGIVAWLGSGFRVTLQSCEAGWCKAVAVDHPAGKPAANYTGYLPETELWGVYQGESFD
jgi:SH3-like domain-containing protein